MEQKAARAAAAKAFKARAVKVRKGHWRLLHEELAWYVDLRADGPRPDAALTFEVGAWVPGLGMGPEPEGGAVDCPLLLDRPLDSAAASAADVAAQVDALVDQLERLDTLDALSRAWRGGDLAGALVDRDLRSRLEE